MGCWAALRIDPMAAHGWRKFVPYEVAPLIAAMAIVGAFATYRLAEASQLSDVRFTRLGGLHSWQEKLREHEEKGTPLVKENPKENSAQKE